MHSTRALTPCPLPLLSTTDRRRLIPCRPMVTSASAAWDVITQPVSCALTTLCTARTVVGGPLVVRRTGEVGSRLQIGLCRLGRGEGRNEVSRLPDVPPSAAPPQRSSARQKNATARDRKPIID